MRFARQLIHVPFACCCLLTILNCATSLGKHELNEPCQHVADCRALAYYCDRNQTCQCAKNHIPNKKRTVCIGAIGEKCRYDSHCGIGAFCSPKEMCECKEEYPFAFNDGFACTDASATKTTTDLALIVLTTMTIGLGNFIS